MDHLIAMVAVGIWGAQLGAPAIWVLPITFPLVMAIWRGRSALPHSAAGAESHDRALGSVLGAAVAVAGCGCRSRCRARGRYRLARSSTGYAHGAELPETPPNPLAYGVGFCRLDRPAAPLRHHDRHADRWPAGERLIQGLGVVIAAGSVDTLALSLGGCRMDYRARPRA